MLTTASLYVATASALGTCLLAHLYRFIALRFHWMDHPNERSAHKAPTPTGAGLAFVVVFSTVLGWLAHQRSISPEILYACLGPIFIALVGFRDDLKSLNVIVRAPAHFLAGAWCIYWIGFPVLNIQGVMIDAGFIALVFGVLALVWLLNLYNFMDGIDGLAAGEAAFVCLGVLLIGGWRNPQGWDLIVVTLLGASLGFLIINWPTAKVFMGDVGSGFLGLTLGVLILAHEQVSVWSWVILLGYFITDACLTIVVRLVRGEKIHESHNLHAYQHLTRRIGGYRTLVIIMLVNFLWLLPMAWLAHLYPDQGAALLAAASAPLLIAEYLCGAGQRTARPPSPGHPRS